MKYRLYTTSQKAWEGMFRAMSAAQESIYLELYTFLDNTETTHNFLKLLKDKARAGLEVVMIIDAFGSSALRHGVAEELRAAGAEFIFFKQLFRRTHRKIIIVDHKVAFIGGVNITEETRNWLDLQIKLQGRIIKPLLESFAHSYRLVGGQNNKILQYNRLPLVKKIKAWITDNLTGGASHYFLNDYYKQKIREARSSIIIVTPYLLPPSWFINLLNDACRRGIIVEMLIPNDTDIKLLNKVNYLNACRLSELGVKFYLSPTMNHAKIMLIDNEEGVIGSQNMDILSFNWNIEVGVFFRQKDLIDDLKKIIADWKKISTIFINRPWQIKLINRSLIAVLKFFYPLF